jgi:hypothetical protein
VSEEHTYFVIPLCNGVFVLAITCKKVTGALLQAHNSKADRTLIKPNACGDGLPIHTRPVLASNGFK